MLNFALAFLAGDMWLQYFAALPSIKMILLLAIIAICLHRLTPLLLYFTCGFIWAWWSASALLAWNLPANAEGKPITVSGYIASMPEQNPTTQRFLFALNDAKVMLKLSADKKYVLMPGQEWQWQVKLKHIHSTQNPGAFDFEAWALQHRVRASGTVINSNENKLLTHHWYHYTFVQLRYVLKQNLSEKLPDSLTAHWLLALMIGDRSEANQDEWRVLRNTGTNHLMAIGGLHIGMLAGFIYLITNFFWRRSSRLLLLLPVQIASPCVGLIAALLYAALSGFILPTQRACLMLLIFVGAIIYRRKISAWQAWSAAMVLVLVMNPLSVLSESFWLSFATIALIIYGMDGRLAPTGWWWKWGRVQWVIGAGLIPLSLILFQEFSLVSFAANCFAIPWLGFFILPLCFISMLTAATPIASISLFLADKSLAVMWWVLTWFADLHFAALHLHVATAELFFVSVVAILFLLAPIGFQGRWLGLFLLLPVVTWQPVKPAFGQFTMTMLDVGQGLSVVVQTQHRTLLFDAGPKLSDKSDAGESIVVPFLHSLNLHKIDRAVISHGDNDHIGGIDAIARAFSISEISSSVTHTINESIPQNFCLAGESWQWDGVQFTFLYPTRENIGRDNDSSCVLMIHNAEHRALLTGDIEKYAEQQLLASGVDLSADVLAAPHHGSKTSGVPDFIQAVHPQFVLYAIGYRNRYHFPHPTVMKSYDEIYAQQLRTDDAGAITFAFTVNAIAIPTLYRVTNKRYWFDQRIV